jgi:hypothetical protein
MLSRTVSVTTTAKRGFLRGIEKKTEYGVLLLNESAKLKLRKKIIRLGTMWK